MAEIIKVQCMVDALRNTGYKNIESAMAEIIDNSIQWHANDIFVITSTKTNSRGAKNVEEIAFLDNGDGMNTETISNCLEFGFTQNTTRKGMGRFGVGLPQSSMYACPCVEVYSWFKDEGYAECKKVYLDMRKVKTGEQTIIEEPIKCEIPEKYRKYLEYKIEKNNQITSVNFKDHGTLVIWKDCDRVNPKTITYLYNRLEYEFGRRYRYFIDKNKCRIRLICHEEEQIARDIMPNDPLLLMESNIILGNPNKPGEIDPKRNQGCTEPLFEVYANEQYPDGEIKFPVKYIKPDTGEIADSTVKIKFSIVKKAFYDKTAITSNPGSTDMGEYVKSLEGISIVRADREIDFGEFHFFDKTNEPQHRWWGCEISFDPELDEAFGVSNNKQHVELKQLDEEDYIDEEVKPMWLQLRDIVSDTIREIYAKNKERRKGARTMQDNESAAIKLINIAESKREDNNDSTSAEIKQTTGEQELNEKGMQQLIKEGIQNPTEEEVRKYIGNSVNIVYKRYGQFGGLFDYTFEFGNALLIVNIDNIFYKTFIEDLEDKMAFEFLLAAFIKAVDVTKASQNQQNIKLINNWNERLYDYTQEENNNN